MAIIDAKHLSYEENELYFTAKSRFVVCIICFAACKKDTVELVAPGRQADPIIAAPDISFNGLGGYDFFTSTDKAFAFDFQRTGRRDYLACYSD